MALWSQAVVDMAHSFKAKRSYGLAETVYMLLEEPHNSKSALCPRLARAYSAK